MGRYALMKSYPYDNRNSLFQSRVLTLNSLAIISLNWAPLFIPELITVVPGIWFVKLNHRDAVIGQAWITGPPLALWKWVYTTLLRLWKGQYKGNQDTKDEWTEVRQGTTENMQARVLSKVNTVETQTLLMTYFQVKHCCPS